jgi:hypothetical protein
MVDQGGTLIGFVSVHRVTNATKISARSCSHLLAAS